MNTAGRRILLLDDDVALREELAESLAAAGHRVELAGDGRAASEDRLRTVDVLILDLSMPVIDGVDLLSRISAMNLSLRTILISGHGDAVLHVAALAARRAGVRVDGVLAKPIDVDALLGLIATDPSEPRLAPSDRQRPEAISAALTSAMADRCVPVTYQPKVDARSFAFAGAEALLGNTWPGLGSITPPEIVAAAQQAGMLTRLTYAVAAEAIAACAAWHAGGFRGPVSINVPIEAVMAADFVPRMIHATAMASIPASCVMLELTEDVVYDSSAEALGALAKLRLAGFGLSLDDVGQRQSGLVQLVNLPVTELKVDMEIVRQARTSLKARSIYFALADLGRRTGISVTAEGVEHPEDVRLAQEAGVTCLQGYWVARKMPLPDLLALLPGLEMDCRARAALASAGHVI